ncbi:glycosyltransferase [Candidatus Neomarinimicrobiota bacterium]
MSKSEQQIFHLFIKKNIHTKTDYEGVHEFTKSLRYYNFDYGYKLAQFRFLIKAIRKAAIHREKLGDIKNNLPKLLLDANCQIIFPANGLLTNGPSSIKKISWIPDFQYKYFPEYFPKVLRIEHHTKKILKLSDLVIVSNEYSKSDVLKYFPQYIHKIRVMPFTMWLGPEWETHDYENVIQKYHIPRKYLICPSQFWVHKNHMRLFKAIAILKKRNKNNIRLVCTGFKQDYRNPTYEKDLYSYIETQELQENIQILGLIPRQDQIQLFRGAAAVVQPSLFEGHSALLDEVHSLGKEAFVSDIPMHREQHARRFVYFDPYKSDDLADKLENRWQSLRSGPNLKKEQLALKKYYLRLDALIKQFREICNSII